MLNKDLLKRYARVLFWGLETARLDKFSKEDIILVRYDLPGRELASVVFSEVLKRKMYPIQRITLSPSMEYSFYLIGDEDQISFIPPGEKELFSNLNGLISILAPESLTHLKDVDPGKIGRSLISRKFLRDILDERENKGLFSWTLCLMPTDELAKNAGLSISEYTDQIIKACYLDYEEPEKKWQEIFENAKHIKEFLNSLEIDTLHLESERCDLYVTPGKDRRWIGISGHNIPSFEIFTSPDWRGTKGVFYMDQPSFRSGNLIKGLKLEFNEGRVVKFTAQEGELFVEKQIHVDDNACKIGEFSLTDKRFSRIDRFMAHTLYDENFGGKQGNCHIALGASYAETYVHGGEKLTRDLKEELGFNDSALHWDLVNTEQKKVTAHLRGGGKRVIYQDGVFAI
ncbi:aminopeptidase [Desulfothermus okinawensis JCM 13304]